MNKIVDSVTLANEFGHQVNAQSVGKAYWSESYERRLQALFEAIIAEDIVNRPSPEDVRTISK